VGKNRLDIWLDSSLPPSLLLLTFSIETSCCEWTTVREQGRPRHDHTQCRAVLSRWILRSWCEMDHQCKEKI